MGVQFIEVFEVVGVDSLALRSFRSHEVQGIVDDPASESKGSDPNERFEVKLRGEGESGKAASDTLGDELLCFACLNAAGERKGGEGGIAFGKCVGGAEPFVLSRAIAPKAIEGRLMIGELIDEGRHEDGCVKENLHGD